MNLLSKKIKNHFLKENTFNQKIWIDLDNTPHVPFFYPIIKKLKKRGYEVLITTRSCFQVSELADRLNIQHTAIGHHYGKNKIYKLFGLFIRAFELMPLLIKEKPGFAVSHGSRAQILASNIVGIPTVLIFDYEHTIYTPLLKPTWVIVPEIIKNKIKQKKSKILTFPGIKEDIYVPNFKPNPNIKREIGLKKDTIVITIRPPATEAHYHNPHSEKLFNAVIDFLAPKSKTQLILLPRNDKQKAFITKRWPNWLINGKIIIPDHVVDGLNLIWHSDLVISGGGTMNREAAALGVPVYSIFRGEIGTIDLYLSMTNRLTLLEKVDDIKDKLILSNWNRPSKPEYSGHQSLEHFVNRLVYIIDNRQAK